MWKPFKTDSHSVAFAMNMGRLAEHGLLHKLITSSEPKYQISKMIGKFDNILEESYQVDKRILNWPMFVEIMFQSKQVVVFHIDENSNVYEGHANNNFEINNFTKTVGKLVEVSEEQANKEWAYTQCKLTQKYYILEE
jgi:hypothetical protein